MYSFTQFVPQIAVALKKRSAASLFLIEVNEDVTGMFAFHSALLCRDHCVQFIQGGVRFLHMWSDLTSSLFSLNGR